MQSEPAVSGELASQIAIVVPLLLLVVNNDTTMLLPVGCSSKQVGARGTRGAAGDHLEDSFPLCRPATNGRNLIPGETPTGSAHDDDGDEDGGDQTSSAAAATARRAARGVGGCIH